MSTFNINPSKAICTNKLCNKTDGQRVYMPAVLPACMSVIAVKRNLKSVQRLLGVKV